MPRQRVSVDTISEIRVDPQPNGLTAVFLVETQSDQEAHDIAKLFEELESQAQVRQLCAGKLVGYALQTCDSNSAILDEIECALKAEYGFVVSQRSFDELIYRIVKELCEDTGSKLLPISHCNICGKAEPFPNTLVTLSDEDGSLSISRCYCGSCTAQAAAPSNKEFIRSLLAADEHDFGKLEQAEMVRHPSRKRPLRFRIIPGNRPKLAPAR